MISNTKFSGQWWLISVNYVYRLHTPGRNGKRIRSVQKEKGSLVSLRMFKRRLQKSISVYVSTSI